MSMGVFPNKDRVELQLNDLVVILSRELSIDVPHEVSIIVPRAELRQKVVHPDKSEESSEVILNSITIVHAPRHPLAGETPPSAGQRPPNAASPGDGIRFIGHALRHIGKDP